RELRDRRASVHLLWNVRGGLSGRSDRADGSVRPVRIDAGADDLRQVQAALGVRRDPAPGADAVRPRAGRPRAGNQDLAVPGMNSYRRGTNSSGANAGCVCILTTAKESSITMSTGDAIYATI